MLQTPPTQPFIALELDMIHKRLMGLRESFADLANDFGVHVDQPELPNVSDEGTQPGLDQLRLAIGQINAQIAYIEQEHSRLFDARRQLFGIDEKWSEGPVNSGPIQPMPPVQPGNFRSHP